MIVSLLILIVSRIDIVFCSVSCINGTICADDGFCDPNTMKCVNSSMSFMCGRKGVFLDCNQTGIVVGECGSGTNADCGNNELCNFKEAWEGVECDYPELVPQNNGFITTHWLCGMYGEYLECSTINGSAVVGVCGSGTLSDCQKYCDGVDGWHAILCADKKYFEVDYDHCFWEKATFGVWLYCPQNYIVTGHCGSAKYNDCGSEQGIGMYHAIQCCPIKF
eukprot:143303_1